MMLRIILFWALLGGVGVAAPRLSTSAAIVGNPEAPKGGKLVVALPAYPKHLLYYLASDEYSAAVNALVLEPLFERSQATYEPVPCLAESWEISRDGKVFTFRLRSEARFSDAMPVTALDVKFTWDWIQNPKNLALPMKELFASFESCEVVDPKTVRFKAKTNHYKNFTKLADLFVLPKHVYEKAEPGKVNKLVGSGPYRIADVNAGERIVLARRSDAWSRTLAQNLGRHNFDEIVFLATADPTAQFEAFKRGEIDYYLFMISKQWATETDGPLFKNGYIKKVMAANAREHAAFAFAWNLRRPLFQDKRVREALSLLMDRERWIKDLFYSQYVPATGIVGSRSAYHSPENRPVAFDPKRARKLLTEAGWRPGKDGVLTRKQARFEFEMLADTPALMRVLTLYQETLKSMGIVMRIRSVDWTTSLKLVDERNFDAYPQSRSRDVEPSDFGLTWSSRLADVPGSQNVTGYKNPEADRLAEAIDRETNENKRIALVRKLDRLIAKDFPMSFGWEPTYFRLGFWDRFAFPNEGYLKYSTWKDTFQYWWLDRAKAERLRVAKEKGEPLS